MKELNLFENTEKVITGYDIYEFLSELNFNYKNEFNRIQFKGKIETIKVQGFKLIEKDGKFIKDKPGYKYNWHDKHYVFNRARNLIEKRVFFDNGKIYQRWFCIYDEKGILVQTNYFDSYDSIYDNITSKYTYKYDENNLLIEVKGHYRNGTSGKLTYKYDKGKLVESPNWIYEYDKNENLIKKESLTSRYVKKYIFQYNQNNRKVLETLYSEGEIIYSLHIFTYDEDKLIEELCFDTDSMGSKKSLSEGTGCKQRA